MKNILVLMNAREYFSYFNGLSKIDFPEECELLIALNQERLDIFISQKRFDLIFVDINFCGFRKGLSFIEEIQSKQPNTQIIGIAFLESEDTLFHGLGVKKVFHYNSRLSNFLDLITQNP